MGDRTLLIEVRWPDGRFHGVRESDDRGRGASPLVGEWPPSPFRLFQALVAGAYGGRWATEDRAAKDEAFAWLEALDPPTVSAAPASALQPVTHFVPNNDLDAKGGDPSLLATIRASKTLRASLFDSDRPATYLWTFTGDDSAARRIADLAGRLHTLGHGVDAAFADADVLGREEGEARLLRHGAAPRRPSRLGGVGGATAPCPTTGSLESLRRRHQAFRGRFEQTGVGRKAATLFRQPPKAHARLVSYDRVALDLLFELQPIEGKVRFRRWPLLKAPSLVTAVRDQLVRALGPVWPEAVERLVIGRGAGPGDAANRIRIVPLPSIGAAFTDPDIRRVLVEIPPDHPIPAADIEWALTGRELADADGELTGILLGPAEDRAMFEAYGAGGGKAARVWRTITPMALPAIKGQNGSQRADAEANGARVIVRALRHAGVEERPIEVRIQREPFDLKGERADRFDADRFLASELRHVEITFQRPVAGPIVVGNGRWLGLGVMRPSPGGAVDTVSSGLHVFEFDASAPLDPALMTRALRRAVMARAQAVSGRRLKRGQSLPTFFTGHDATPVAERVSAPASGGKHAHLFYALDEAVPERPRLLIVAPHLADRSVGLSRDDRDRLDWLAEALDGLETLRAGTQGLFRLSSAAQGADGPLLAPARVWVSQTAYQPTRHPNRGQDSREWVIADVLKEASRRCLPRPEVEVLSLNEGARGGLRAHLRLSFAVAVDGPLLLGKMSHFGSGLFTGRRSLP